ncbi:MAG TPA: SMC family ATPase [Desulfomonilaceae bacterium]|nr:SMC family ATPase [Desulfomonilaceae bacterium]
MRPLQLTMSAFGPYPGNHVLNFRELGASRLFLIHGPTGSGKTTILDAMCYALYGTCSGGDRDAKGVRSDHADPAIATEVTFNFRLRDREYRVFRRPEHQRPKKRGGGTTATRPEAVLYRVSGDEEPSVLATQWHQVTDAVERLLGFRCDQFRQIVMLPQGEFRKLLLADSRERQRILEVLFGTELYRRIEESLKQAAKDVENSREKTKDYLDLVLKQAGVESREQLQEDYDLAREQSSAMQTELARLKVAEKKAREGLVRGNEILEKFQEQEFAEGHFHSIHENRDANEARRTALAASRQAATLLSAEKILDARSREAEEATTKLRRARIALTGAVAEQKSAAQQLAVENQRQEVVEELRFEINRLDALTEKVLEVQSAVKKVGEARTGLDRTNRKVKTARNNLETLRVSLNDISAAKIAAEKFASQRDLLLMRQKEMETACRQKEQLRDLAQDESAAREKLLRAKAQVESTELSLSRSVQEYKSLESAWIQGQAAVLARGLVPGAPCPVCGSLEHPLPAVTEAAIPGERLLKTKAGAVDKLRQDLDRMRTEKLGSEARIEAVRETQAMLTEHLGEFGRKDLALLQLDLKALKKAVQEADESAMKCQELTDRARTVSQSAAQAEEILAGLEGSQNEAVLVLQRAEAEVRALERDIPDEYQNSAALDRAKESARKRVASLTEAFAKAQDGLSRAHETLAACRAAETAAEDAAAISCQRSLNQRQEFASSLRQAGFRDEVDFRAAKRPQAEMLHLEKEIQQYDSSLNSAADRLERAKTATQGLELPDMDALRAVAAGTTEELQTAMRREAALSQKMKSLGYSLQEYHSTARELEQLDGKYAVVGRISEVASGQNNERISFHRFVLAALLDDVLSAASVRLRIMSNGRFLLQRATRIADRRLSSGLDLEIHDSYTGTERPVSTLSGGESFLASLALALGLADTVQAYAGGIHLDTIFVDEGFGSLDPEALDLAFRALFDLQNDGRMVGIISHVPDLKERLDVRLEVRSTRRGSTARFIVGSGAGNAS